MLVGSRRPIPSFAATQAIIQEDDDCNHQCRKRELSELTKANNYATLPGIPQDYFGLLSICTDQQYNKPDFLNGRPYMVLSEHDKIIFLHSNECLKAGSPRIAVSQGIFDIG